MLISEIFYSIQGEGKLVGVPSVFIRTSGCNLRCIWCDSPYTSWKPEGLQMPISEIVSVVEGYPTQHVVITGGEPFLQKDLETLCDHLSSKHLTIETAGTVFQPVPPCLISLSPKLATSNPVGTKHLEKHDHLRHNQRAIRRFLVRYDYQIKFVVCGVGDLPEIKGWLDEFRVTPDNVWLMPEGRSRREIIEKQEWLVELCKQEGFNYSPRLQIDIWGNQRGT